MTEKEKQIRVVLVESSLVITVLFFLPFTKTVMNLLGEGETYYRILWLLPMAVVIVMRGSGCLESITGSALLFCAGAGADRKVGVQQPVSVKGAEPVSYSKIP